MKCFACGAEACTCDDPGCEKCHDIRGEHNTPGPARTGFESSIGAVHVSEEDRAILSDASRLADDLAAQVGMVSTPPDAEPKPCGTIATATWCCQYHGEHSDDEVERDLASAREQALNSVTALRDVKNERDKAEREVEHLQKVLAEHVNENLALHRENEQLRQKLERIERGAGHE
jgi:hypothetical protein